MPDDRPFNPADYSLMAQALAGPASKVLNWWQSQPSWAEKSAQSQATQDAIAAKGGSLQDQLRAGIPFAMQTAAGFTGAGLRTPKAPEIQYGNVSPEAREQLLHDLMEQGFIPKPKNPLPLGIFDDWRSGGQTGPKVDEIRQHVNEANRLRALGQHGQANAHEAHARALAIQHDLRGDPMTWGQVRPPIQSPTPGPAPYNDAMEPEELPRAVDEQYQEFLNRKKF